jgi:uncharacterized protein (TIGR02118 family)
MLGRAYRLVALGVECTRAGGRTRPVYTAALAGQWEPTMVKLTIFAVRKPGLTHAEFDAYWRDEHGPLVRSVHEFARHVRRYVQCHGVEGARGFGSDGGYDGVAELYFDDVEAIARAFAEPRYLEVIRPDERKFVDIERCVSYVSEELEVFAHPAVAR